MISRPMEVAAATATAFTTGVATFATSSAVDGCAFSARGSGGGLDGAADGAVTGVSRAASRSYAESRSTCCPYPACKGDAATAALMAAGSVGPINDSGARSLVQATGVGEPRSDSTVITASPIPIWVSTAPRS